MKVISSSSARPNFVKLAAVHHAIEESDFSDVEHQIIHTGQHYDPLFSDIFFEQLKIPLPAFNLGVHGGEREEVIDKTEASIKPIFKNEKPDAVLVYGDVNGAVGAARAAVDLGIPVVHVEAGLRSYDMTMPEEINRIEVDKLSKILFCSEQSGMMAGLAFVICNKLALNSLKDLTKRSFYLSLYDQYEQLEKTGEMRFTPPVQVFYSLKQAIEEYFEEGGLKRYKRYTENWQVLRYGLQNIGFDLLLKPEHESHILLTVREPNHPKFDYNKMHDLLYYRGFTIYPGKIKEINSFRLSNIGDLSKDDIELFLENLNEVLIEMKVKL